MIIKKIFYISLLFVSAGSFLLSCGKKLELPGDGRITLDDVFHDYNQVRGYLSSCYGYSPEPNINRIGFTDEAQHADDVVAGSKYSNWYIGAVTPTNFALTSVDASPWSSLYEGVRKCNVFLGNLPNSTVIVSETIKAGWTAQARALRALYYLQLIKRYGAVPILDKPLPIGYDFSQMSRSSFSKVVSFILSDCEAALAAPNESDGFSWNIYDRQMGIMTRAVVYAIMSEAVTYAASPLWSDGTYTWDDATRINALALAQCLANDYRLFDVSPVNNAAQNAYALYFFTSSNDQRAIDKETIYHLGPKQQVWRYAGLPTTTGAEWAGPSPAQELVDSYEMATGAVPIIGYADADRTQAIINSQSGYDPKNPYIGRDPRFYASVYYNGAVRFLNQPNGRKVMTQVGGAEEISNVSRTHTRTGYYLRKFNNFQSDQNNDADGGIRLFRLAELYLNFAESAYQSVGPDVKVNQGNFSMTAREAVNVVRNRAGMPGFPVGMTKEDFELKYRNERRIELAFEGHRYFDVRRWKILDKTDRFVTGMRITQDNSGLTYTRFKFPNRNSWADKYLLYPLDQEEVDKIIGWGSGNWQNPGW